MITGRNELMFQIGAFIADKGRGIPISHFARLCGMNRRMLDDIFVYRNTPLTAEMQIRVAQAWDRWCKGAIKVEFLGNSEKARVTAREAEDAKPKFRRIMRAPIGKGMELGIVPKYDYHYRVKDDAR